MKLCPFYWKSLQQTTCRLSPSMSFSSFTFRHHPPQIDICIPSHVNLLGVTLILTPIIANCVSARHCREP